MDLGIDRLHGYEFAGWFARAVRSVERLVQAGDAKYGRHRMLGSVDLEGSARVPACPQARLQVSRPAIPLESMNVRAERSARTIGCPELMRAATRSVSWSRLARSSSPAKPRKVAVAGRQPATDQQAINA